MLSSFAKLVFLPQNSQLCYRTLDLTPKRYFGEQEAVHLAPACNSLKQLYLSKNVPCSCRRLPHNSKKRSGCLKESQACSFLVQFFKKILRSFFESNTEQGQVSPSIYNSLPLKRNVSSFSLFSETASTPDGRNDQNAEIRFKSICLYWGSFRQKYLLKTHIYFKALHL